MPKAKSNQERGASFRQRKIQSGGTSLLINLDATDSVKLDLLAHLSQGFKSETMRAAIRFYFEYKKDELKKFREANSDLFRRIVKRPK